MNIRISTVEPMLKIIEELRIGTDVSERLNDLLDHPDYQIQFDFFNNHPANIGFSKVEFMEMFLDIDDYQPADTTSLALKMRHVDLKDIFNNLDFYKEKLTNLKTLSQGDFNQALMSTNIGLEKAIDTNDVQMIVAIGVGVTGAFNQGEINFFDYGISFSSKTKQGFLNTFSHEMHHLGFKNQFKINLESYQPADLFLHYFAGEGLAVKFGNNFEGVWTGRLHDYEHTSNEVSYGYYRDHVKEIHGQLLEDLKVLSGPQASQEMASNLFDDHYWQRDVMVDGQLKEFYLKNPLAYYLGADIWGLLYDSLDRDTFFDKLKSPEGLSGIFLACLEEYCGIY